MSKLTRAITIGAILAAMSLTGTTAVAQTQSSDRPTSPQDARRPPTEAQVGESWRHPQLAADNSALDDTRRPPTEAQVGESWRHRQAPSKEQTAADAALQRVQARERFSIPSATPAQATAPLPSKSSRQPRWLIASLAVLVAGLALAGGLAVLAARRTGRKARAGLAA